MLYAELLLFGVCVGLISGLLGIGGGIVLVPGLMLWFHFSQPEAQGTSLAVLIPPIGIFAALAYYQRGDVQIPVAITVALGFVIGAYGGARLLPYVSLGWLRLAFGGLLLYVGFVFILEMYLPRTLAALPAGIAAMFLALGAWLRGKQAVGAQKTPGKDDIQYHI